MAAISDYKQSLQFQNLNEEKRNIKVEPVEVVRRGRRTKVSIFDLVVGDIVPLKIGDQVPADGVLISGHPLSVDESSMTGESKHVHKDQKAPFFISGCKVVDGYGTMLARAGIQEKHFLPFNPVEKRTAIDYVDSNGKWHMSSKSAPEQ